MTIWAVVVLYQPDPGVLREQFDAVCDQVDGVLYVDNGAGRAALAETGVLGQTAVTLIGAGTNVGLAAALNSGLDEVRRRGAEFALLLDQDSLPDVGMVATLLRLLQEHDIPARPVAAIGPAIIDLLRGETEYFARLKLPFNHRIHPGDDAVPDAFEVDFLISSGTVLALAALADIGGMDEALFIDSVDFDWSFRATARGYALLATFTATMRHRRGDNIYRIAPGLSVRLHSPFRLFYMYRNRVRLYRRSYVPLAWKVHDLGRMLLKGGLLATAVPDRRANLSAMWRGVRAGLRD